MSIRNTIFDIVEFAKLKGGELLSKSYINNKEKLFWKCKCGNMWHASWVGVRYSNSWCPVCSKEKRNNKLKKYNTDDIRNHISHKEGILLSDKYVNYDNKLDIICKNGHKFKITARQIEAGNWCNECGKNKFTINNILNSININGGELLSLISDIINSHSNITIKCSNNHIWKTRAYNIIYNKTWCPYCVIYLGEEKVKNFLEKNSIKYIRQHTFNNLKGSTNRKTKLRFDFYLPEINILIEYDGEQHYKPKAFHKCSKEKAEKSFLELKQNDEIKNKYCIDNNIRLIRIPYTEKNIEEFLKIILSNNYYV